MSVETGPQSAPPERDPAVDELIGRILAGDHPPVGPKDRMKIDRVAMPEQDADVRSHTFGEVNLGLPETVAFLEAERCLDCRNPVCIDGCPVHVNIPRFLTRLRAGDMRGAADSLLDDNALPCVTGRVCPQESQCEGHCLRGKKGPPVAIGWLERYVGDWAQAHRGELASSLPTSTGKRVAIVGSGPAGLTAASELARRGHAVTIFEAFHAAGGVLIYGIPEFRLPKDIVAREVERLEEMGVEIRPNAIVGKTWTLPELRAEFDAIFLAVGAGLPVFMNVPGENFKGVYSANEYLTRVNLMGAYTPDADTPVLHGQRVVVVGGGNVAMDSVRTARRLGAAEATIVYRRGPAEMPARAEEVHHAAQEGVRFEYLAAPVEVVGDERHWVTGLRCIRMALGEPDASGRSRPEPIPGSEFTIPADLVVVAIGTRSNPLLTATAPDLELTERGYIVTDDHAATSVPGVFAGGDIVRGAATVILAMGDGKRAAASIDAYLSGTADAENPAPDLATATSA
ncbi:MAG TPA: NADPH-dependent glutamate synthase [Candidatus Limnocylindrales bacterium]|nr:NADPH-dependent glutamate synthase [Candidatus Limnocylindrales bacterium]